MVLVPVWQSLKSLAASFMEIIAFIVEKVGALVEKLLESSGIFEQITRIGSNFVVATDTILSGFNALAEKIGSKLLSYNVVWNRQYVTADEGELTYEDVSFFETTDTLVGKIFIEVENTDLLTKEQMKEIIENETASEEPTIVFREDVPVVNIIREFLFKKPLVETDKFKQILDKTGNLLFYRINKIDTEFENKLSTIIDELKKLKGIFSNNQERSYFNISKRIYEFIKDKYKNITKKLEPGEQRLENIDIEIGKFDESVINKKLIKEEEKKKR
jgi:hypothetical protein